MATVLHHATASQLGAAFRARYRDAVGVESARLARWLLARIADGTFTDAQCRAAFGGLSAAQWGAVKTRMQSRADRLTAAEAEIGE